MKLLSKLPLLAVLFALAAAFAFTPPVKREVKADYFWFQLKPGGNQNTAADYDKVSAPAGCSSGTPACAVKAQSDNGMPYSHPLGIPASGNVTPNGQISQVLYKN